MEKTGIVKTVNPQGTWTSQKGGTMYKYEITMDDGTFGEYSSSKYESTEVDGFPFKLGESVEYVFEGGKYPKIKQAAKPNFNGGGFRQDASDAINYHVALKEAREIVSMDGWGGNDEMADKIKYLSDIAYQIARHSKMNIEKLKAK